MKIETLHQYFLESTGVCTDTRKIKKGCLFFALKGENFDGNNFTKQAIEAGAYKVVIDAINQHQNTGKTILTKDSLTLLQKLATYHRKHLNTNIIALTGSNGKTTTKELINAVLSQKYNTTATVGNLNNHIGVPLTLLKMTKETEIGIVEMGANHLKEIAFLCNIALPDYGYITNFGKAHLEGFGSLEGVIQGKSEMYNHIIKHSKKIFVNANDAKQQEITKKVDVISFGNELQDYHIQLLDTSKELVVSYQGVSIQSNLIGIYNFHNIAAAIAIGAYFKVSAQHIKKAIEAYIPTNNRSQKVTQNGHQIILDAYNANPTSMIAAIKSFEQAEGKNKILFLGDMFELGHTAAAEHQLITSYLDKNKIGTSYLIGSNFAATTAKSNHIHLVPSFEDLKKILTNKQLQSSHILIKASRGMALERIVDLL